MLFDSVNGYRVDNHLRHLYSYLIENGHIAGMRDFDENCIPIFSRQVLAKIRNGDSSWESEVPEPVVKMIKERNLLQEDRKLELIEGA